MEDKTTIGESQPQGISDALRQFIEALAEEVVLEGKPFDTQKKWLRRYSEAEGVDYEELEKNLNGFFETMEELKRIDSKAIGRLAGMLAKDCYLSEGTADKLIKAVEDGRAKEEAERKAREESARKAKEETERKAQEEAARKAKEEAERKAREEAARKAKEESERKAREEAARKVIKWGQEQLDFNVNGVKFKMRFVKGGSLDLGDTPEQKNIYCGLSNGKVMNVKLGDFYMGETVVTQALWQVVMGNNPSVSKGANLPVETVTWDMCQDFIRKLNNILAPQLAGRNFSLPTESQWEYAARGGQKSKGYRFSGSNNASSVAWHLGNSNDQLHAVAQKQANELGLYDMSGNVSQWCLDCKVKILYENPDLYRSFRGGSYLYGPFYGLVSSRYVMERNWGKADLGFRLLFQ